MFNFKKSLDGSVMQLVKMPAVAGEYKVGMALTYSGGKLAAASGNAVVQYICADNAKLEAAGDLIVSPVTADMIFNAKLTAYSADTVAAGERLQISADGMGVTATAGTEVLNTDGEAFGGLGRIAEGQEYPVFDEREGRELVQRVRVYLPSRTALVLRRS